MDRQQQQYKARVEANRVVEQQSQALRAAEEDEKLLEEYAEAMRSLEAAVGAGNTPPAGVMVNATAGLLRAANVEYRAAMAALSAAHAMYVTERNAVVAHRKRMLELVGQFAEAMPRLRSAALLEDPSFDLQRLFQRDSIADAVEMEWKPLGAELGLSWETLRGLHEAMTIEVRPRQAHALNRAAPNRFAVLADGEQRQGGAERAGPGAPARRVPHWLQAVERDAGHQLAGCAVRAAGAR